MRGCAGRCGRSGGPGGGGQGSAGCGAGEAVRRRRAGRAGGQRCRRRRGRSRCRGRCGCRHGYGRRNRGGPGVRTVRMCPYWMARATRPPGRRAMCQARVLRKRVTWMGPSGSSGMCWPVRFRLAASRLAQAVKSLIRRFSPAGFQHSGAFWPPWWAAANRSSPAGTICSRTRMALTTGVMATQGTSRSSPAETWWPSVSMTFLKCREWIRWRPVCRRGRVRGRGASCAQVLDFRPHAGQVPAHDRGRAQVAHQGLGLVEVERRPPRLSRDPAGHRDVHRARPGTEPRDFRRPIYPRGG